MRVDCLFFYLPFFSYRSCYFIKMINVHLILCLTSVKNYLIYKCNKTILILLLAEVYSIQNDQEVG